MDNNVRNCICSSCSRILARQAVARGVGYPYTLARKNSIDFVLNADYAITTLREEAFAMLSKDPAAAAGSKG